MTLQTEIPSLSSSGHQPGLLAWLRFSLIWLLLAGLLYPLVTTVLAGTLFPRQANGSLIEENGTVVGSRLIGQSFSGDQYFVGRPSAAGAGYDPVNASGSNLATSNPALRERIQASAQSIAQREGIPVTQVPVDLVTASGSGLDPHITSAGAAVQVARVAKARGMTDDQVRTLVQSHTERGVLGLGQPGVNVLTLNLALDAGR
ncbi:potassium-transporting ATPase subunit KdpC [Deinococcus sp. HMF7604]|uniref:potassium-transporting ATPase subunit KdpC n=1 Tax=Deinococcus betulae TaxID=2873312 RepID=UPI001CCBC073|nr:potassium-transporting ATPase subunit KdpC [Deinococcus betulae]MBZ9752849.1 potassium-transporting ATPase subunit KdpC [Deinococcus betulae]